MWTPHAQPATSLREISAPAAACTSNGARRRRHAMKGPPSRDASSPPNTQRRDSDDECAPLALMRSPTQLMTLASPPRQPRRIYRTRPSRPLSAAE
ncbi:protein of unknown function [Burkholderia multivorans]